jgi:antitoxin ParD1/3/4
MSMDQMNISITDRLAGFVREKVSSGHYNNASEVVREALRRMEEEDERALRLADPTIGDLLADLSETQSAAIRNRVLAGIDSIDRGDFTDYQGRAGLAKLSAQVKARGHKRLETRKQS